MPVKKGVVIAGVGVTGAPVAGYFIYSKLSGGSSATSTPQIPGLVVLNSNRNDGKAFEIENSCIKEKFSLEKIKDNIDETKPNVTKTDTDKLDLADHSTGEVEGCLATDVRSRNSTNKQHAIWGRLEMTLIKGSHGLIFRTMLTNLLDEGRNASFQHLNQAYKLTKGTDGKWKIDHGYLWTDEVSKHLMESSNTEKANLIIGGLATAQVDFWNLCTMGNVATGSGDQKCEKLDDDALKTSKLQRKKWEKSAQNGKGVFEHLTIKGGKEKNEQLGTLWGKTSDSLFKVSLDGGKGNKYMYEETKGFQQIQYQHNEDKAQKNLTKWFEPFKDAKGSWT